MSTLTRLTVPDIAARYSKSEYQVRENLKRGLIPGFKVAGRWYADPVELDEWEKARHPKPAQRDYSRTARVKALLASR